MKTIPKGDRNCPLPPVRCPLKNVLTGAEKWQSRRMLCPPIHPPHAGRYRLVHPRPLRHVHPLGALRPARAARVGQDPRADDRRGLRPLFPALRPRSFRPPRLGKTGQGRRHEVRGADHQAPRGLLPLGQPSSPTTRRPTRPPGATSCARSSTPSAPRASASASTIRCSTGTIRTSRSTPSIRAGTIRTPCSRTRAATCIAMPSTCATR